MPRVRPRTVKRSRVKRETKRKLFHDFSDQAIAVRKRKKSGDPVHITPDTLRRNLEAARKATHKA